MCRWKNCGSIVVYHATGVRPVNIAKAARNHGLEVKAFKKEPEQLKDLPVPMIVFWNFYHFLVVEGFGKNKVYLNDPASGPRVVDYKTFNDSFTGVVLTFKPGPEFQPGGERPKFFSILMNWLKGYKTSLLFLFLVGLAIIVPGLAIPVFSKIFIDQILIKQSESWIIPLLIGIALTTLLRVLLSWLQQHSLIRFEMSLSLKNSSKFLWHVLHLPMSFHTQRSAGDITMRININDQIACFAVRSAWKYPSEPFHSRVLRGDDVLLQRLACADSYCCLFGKCTCSSVYLTEACRFKSKTVAG
jgi:ABC-type bacteriocin/lantibiotic exporter with double-glycine peptidase domain